MKLDLGCGKVAQPGFVGVDFGGAASVIADMRALPFKDGVATEIYCGHAIEHVPAEQTDAFMREIRRVLKLGGKVTIRTPDGVRGLLDPFHYRAFNGGSFYAWCRTDPRSLQYRPLFSVSCIHRAYIHDGRIWNRLPHFIAAALEKAFVSESFPDSRLRTRFPPGARELTVCLIGALPGALP